MNNFIFENKTKVYFGKGGVKEYLGCLLGNYGETVMLAYGGGSIKRNGVYDEIMDILNAAGKRVVEFDRIMPNPTYAKAQEGAKLARENHVDLILAVGGGSVSDCCKVISAQAKLDEDIWELENSKHTFPTEFIPLGTIVTVFGTGSEMYYQFSERYFRIYMFLTLINGIQPVTSNFFNSIGKARLGVFMSLTRQILFLLPLIVIFPLFMGIDGVMYAGPIADGAAAIVCGLFTVRELRELTRLQQKTEKTN